MLSLFTANTETYNALQAQTRLQEGANFGLNVIARDLQRAGYRGCYSRGDVYVTAATVPAALILDLVFRFTMATQTELGLRLLRS